MCCRWLLLFQLLTLVPGGASKQFYPELAYELIEQLADFSLNGFRQLEHYELARLAQHFVNVTEPSVSQECIQELSYLGYSLATLGRLVSEPLVTSPDKKSKFLIPMMDSAAKVGPGIARGHLQHTGNFPECKRAQQFAAELNRTIQGDYYRVLLDVKLRPHGAPGACGIPQIGVDLCLPTSCRNDNLTHYFRKVFLRPTSSPVCHVRNVNALVPKPIVATYVVASIVLFVFLLCVVAGIVDYICAKKMSDQLVLGQKGKDDRNSFLWKTFMTFSFYSNFNEVLSTEKNTGKEGQIDCLNCIRFISTLWVILGHGAAFITVLCGTQIFAFVFTNPRDLLDLMGKYPTLLLSNAYFAVDTFFFISGLLVSFLWFKQLKRQRNLTLSAKGWILFYAHRLIRLSPAYYMTIMFYTFVATTLMTDMPIFLTPMIEIDHCRENFWLNLLYVNNLINTNHICYVVSWYLAADLQIYVFTPILLFAFAWFGAIAGSVLAVFVVLLSTRFHFPYGWNFSRFAVCNVAEVLAFRFPPTEYQYGPKDPLMSERDYQRWNYYQPLIRCQIYIMGVVLGYFLHRTPRMNISNSTNILMWLLTTIGMLTVVGALHDYTAGNLWSSPVRAAYSSLSRIVWGMGLSWIVVSTYYTKSVVQEFMSLAIWAPLGRLCYSAYLLHIIVFLFYFGSSFADIYFVSLPQMMYYNILPVTVISFASAAIWCCMFEAPFAKIENLLLGNETRRSRAKENDKFPIDVAPADALRKEAELAWNA